MPQSSRKTRERQLARLAERRRRERIRRRRQRIVAIAVALVVAVGGLGFAGYTFIFGGSGEEPAASGTPTPTASPTPSIGGVACGGSVPEAAELEKKTYMKAPKRTLDSKKTYTATVRTSCGSIRIQLDPKLAPNTVNSFVFLARERFFDGLIFHRIAKEFVIQGGDPSGTGTGGPGYKTVDAPPEDAKYGVGVVAMAKGGDEAAGTSGSQFFIVITKDSELPAEYAIIGKVLEGQDVAEAIGALPIEAGATDGRPAQTVYIERITIRVS